MGLRLSPHWVVREPATLDLPYVFCALIVSPPICRLACAFVPYRLPIDLHHFPTWVPSPAALELTDGMLVWAAATLGERRRAPRNSDFVRAANRRVATLLDAFSTPCGCHLTHSPNYRLNMDPTERSDMSYFLGGISAKLAAALLVGVPYLVHYDAVLRENGLSLRGRRPDFVGVGDAPLSARVIVEAKGTSGARNAKLADAVEQAKGGRPQPRIRRLAWGQQAHFAELGYGWPTWSATLVDPPSEDFVFPDLDDLIVAYFRPLVDDILGSGYVEVDGSDATWRVAELPETRVQVAVRSDIAVAAAEGDGALLVALCELESARQPDSQPSDDDVVATLTRSGETFWGAPAWPNSSSSNGSTFVGPDGIAVRITFDAEPRTDRQGPGRLSALSASQPGPVPPTFG